MTEDAKAKVNPEAGGARRLSRRRFLKNTTAAVAAPLVVSAATLGRSGFGATAVAAPSERIALAVIGLGQRGGAHTDGLLPLGDVQLVGCCDPQAAKREIIKKRIEDAYAARGAKGTYKGCLATADYRELLSREELDGVVIAAPENWHALMMADAAKAGKDVYGEKALSLTVAEGRAVCDAVRRYGCVFQVGTQQRSDRNFRFACELARNGYLGKVHTVRVGVPGGRALPVAQPKPAPPEIDYDMWLGPAPWTPYNDQKCSFNWYFIYDYCAGWVQSWGVHHVDIALWGAAALGKGKIEVEGSAVFPAEGMADTSITWDVNCTTPDGLRLHFTDNSKEKQGCRFEGDQGWVHVRRGGIQAEPASLLRVKIKPDEEHLYESNNHHRNFLDCMRSRKDPVSHVEAGHAATTLTLVSDIATRTRRKLTWDWSAEKFVNDPGADRYLRRPMRSPWRM